VDHGWARETGKARKELSVTRSGGGCAKAVGKAVGSQLGSLCGIRSAISHCGAGRRWLAAVARCRARHSLGSVSIPAQSGKNGRGAANRAASLRQGRSGNAAIRPERHAAQKVDPESQVGAPRSGAQDPKNWSAPGWLTSRLGREALSGRQGRVRGILTPVRVGFAFPHTPTAPYINKSRPRHSASWKASPLPEAGCRPNEFNENCARWRRSRAEIDVHRGRRARRSPGAS